MLYVRIIDEQIQYPYMLEMLVSAYPDISFPDVMDNMLLADFGVYSVEDTPAPDETLTKKVVELDPVDIIGKWTQQWELVDKTFIEIHTQRQIKSYEVRKERDKLLSDSDWVVISSLERGKLVPQDWVDYRQDLRDIPFQQGFPYDVILPVKPLTKI